MNNWIMNGGLIVYDLSILFNPKLFIITFPIYFQKKLNENNFVSSDKINIYYQLTKFEKVEEINDEILENIRKENGNNEFILIKGLKLKNFESFYEKENKIYFENLNKKEGEELPIILVTYSINSFDNIKTLKSLQLNSDDEDSEISKLKSQSLFEKDEEEYDQVQEMSEISMAKINTKFLNNKSAYHKDKSMKKTDMQKYKYITLKKFCKINVPIIDEDESDCYYGINEPLGYIEMKFKCTNDKQEEYFINNKVQINIDN